MYEIEIVWEKLYLLVWSHTWIIKLIFDKIKLNFHNLPFYKDRCNANFNVYNFNLRLGASKKWIVSKNFLEN